MPSPLYEIQVKEDGTWLYLNGPSKQFLLRLENVVGSSIGQQALTEIRTAIVKAEQEATAAVEADEEHQKRMAEWSQPKSFGI